jgi:hypothetical protein
MATDEPPETLLCPLYPQQNTCRSVLDLSGVCAPRAAAGGVRRAAAAEAATR